MFLHDQETAVDLLYYEPIAKTVARLIAGANGKALTVGVHGDWGAGKSSVLKMIERNFADDKAGSNKTVCVWFNGWAFEGYDDAKSVVIETIVDELKRARPGNVKVADAAMDVLRRVNWLKITKRAGGLAFNIATGLPSPDQIGSVVVAAKAFLQKPQDKIDGEDISGFVDEAAGYLKEKDDSKNTVPAQIHAFRESFETLLKHAEVAQLIVLVDDLDRCLPATAIGTLEAIRLFLFVPRTAFVIAADEAMIEYSVRQHFPDLPASSGPTGYARNYLEKLIQVPFRIPALGAAETRTYITLLLAQAELGEANPEFEKLLKAAKDALRQPWSGKVLDRATIEKQLGTLSQPVDDAVKMAGQISGVLSEGTRGNPRQVKRFLNTLALRIEVADDRGFGDQIERPVLAKLMLAERFAPDIFEQVARDAATTPKGNSQLIATWEDGTSGEREAQAKGKQAKPPAIKSPDGSAESDWVKAWAKIEPPLAGKDLRPYIFVSRDKRNYFGSRTGADHLQELLSRLMGNRMAAVGSLAEVQKLGPIDAEQLFDVLKESILTATDLTKDVPGVAGLAVLVKGQPSLQGKLLVFLENLPPAKTGAWAASSWAGCFDATHSAKLSQIMAIWAEEGSASLKAVVIASQKMGKG